MGGAAPTAGPPTLVAIGLEESEAKLAVAAMCSRTTVPSEGIARALHAVECARRTGRGTAYEGAVVIDGARAWGAAIRVPAGHLASRTAGWAVRYRGGLHEGAHIMQPMAECPLRVDPVPAEPPPRVPPIQVGQTRVGEPDADEDAGVEGAALTARVADGIREAPAALLLRDDAGRFHAGLLVEARLALAREDASALLPTGHDVVPGQLAFAGPDGAVVVAAGLARDPLRAPAPAAYAYEALTAGRSLDGRAAVGLTATAIVYDAAVPLLRYELPRACASLAEAGP